MSKVAIVTDSTAYLPDHLLEEYHITVAPQVLIWGEETYEDGVDIQPAEFYSRLENADVMPTTSQVTPKSFNKVFSDLLGKDHQVLAILLPSELSGTVASAIQARDNFPDAPIEIVESNMTAMALGFQALAAARAAADGAGMNDCKSLAEKAQGHTGVVFVVDTLEFLHRGGRIGGGSRFLGTALSIKPILEVKGGRVEAIEQVRTRKKSLNRLIELVEERVDGRKPVRLASLHANAPEAAQNLLSQALERIETAEHFVSGVSPVIGAQAGPGTVALAYMAGM